MGTAKAHNPSKSLDDFHAIQRTFSVELARQIASRVGIPALLDPDDYDPEVKADPNDIVYAQLARRLNDAAGRWAWSERLQTSASPKMRSELAHQVAARTMAVLSLVQTADGDLVDSLGAGGLWAQAALEGAVSGRNAVAESISALQNLQRWALAMAEREARAGINGSSARRQADGAFVDLIGELGGIYILFWRRVPALSRPDQVTPGGPFFRFVAAVMDELDAPKTDGALATAIARHPMLRAFRAMGK